MTGAHVTGGALGALLGAVLAPLLARYGVSITDSTAALIGTGALSLGVGLGHVVSTQGLWPALRRVFIGPPKPDVQKAEARAEATQLAQLKQVSAPPPPQATPAPPLAPPATPTI